MKNAPTIQHPLNPQLYDELLIRINAKLLNTFPWLNNSFGKSQTLTRKNTSKRVIKYPAVYTGHNKEYASMLPNESYGNFSYWEVGDYKVTPVSNQMQIVEAPFGFIVWLNLNKVLDIEQRRNLESIKADILSFFDKSRYYLGRVTIDTVTEDARKIYSGYSITEAEQQFMMHPFAALRFDGTLRYERTCAGNDTVIVGTPVSVQPSIAIEQYLIDLKQEFDDYKLANALGFGYLTNTTNDVNNPIAFEPNVWKQLPLSYDTAEVREMPVGWEQWIDNATGSLNGVRVGNAYLIRVTFSARQQVSSTNVEFDLDIGGAQPILIYPEFKELYTDAASDKRYTLLLDIFSLETFIANKGRLMARFDGVVDIYDIVIKIQLTNRGKDANQN